MGTEDHLVEALEELDGLQVLLTAVDVGYPLSGLAGIVQVEHGGDRIHPQAVKMELIQPKHGGGVEEGAHLVASVVKDVGAPVGVLSLPGVSILVGGGAVKVIEAELIPGEVGGDPVHDDADASLVHLVHEIHQVVGGTEAAGGGKVAGTLVTPGGIQGMFGDREELHMGEAQLLHIGDQIGGQIPVAEELPFPRAAPGAQVTFIDVHRAAVGGVFGPIVQPGPVPPLVTGEVVKLGGGAWASLCVEGKGVSLAGQAAILGMYCIFIRVILLKAGDEPLPDAALNRGQRVGVGVPVVEITKDTHLLGVGGPDSEIVAGDTVLLAGMGAEALPGMGAVSITERSQFMFRGINRGIFLRFGQ